MPKQEAQFHYFWLKVVKADQIHMSGKAALDNPALQVLSSIEPDHQRIIPQPTKTKIFMSGQPVDTHFTVRLDVDPAKEREHGLSVRYFPMSTPMTREQALAWIKDTGEKGGAAWAMGGLCVLCSVAVEPLA